MTASPWGATASHDVAPAGARLDVRDPGHRVDRDLSVVQLEPEQERVAEVRESLGQVSGRLRGDPQTVVAGVGDRRLDVLDAGRHAHGGWALIGVQVPGATRGVVMG